MGKVTKILAIDSSGLVASAAVLADDTLVAEFTVNNKKTHSQTLLPMVDQVMKMSGIGLRELDAIAVAAGPGSFTGLRIGSSTAKGMALALEIPIVSVPTLEGLAYRITDWKGVVCPLMDARRNQVYTGVYRVKPGQLDCVAGQQAAAVPLFLQQLNELGEEVLFLGDGVPVYEPAIREQLTVSYQFAPVHMNRQSAGAVAALGKIYFEQGKTETGREHKPVYLRQSQAERERAGVGARK
ncbi:MAG: tRNA (adenosine(37)-N6)-threonylcarbamoyltransferase complex dimerization subunit type 1 TsaB [Clostridiaceae bacterium]|nr:tRNA (adenosine(37)-N6)-threonylcarbamoyltransferase complex dimerization subunit type 1 TsaB [Clostridiaceae bacterium]